MKTLPLLLLIGWLSLMFCNVAVSPDFRCAAITILICGLFLLLAFLIGRRKWAQWTEEMRNRDEQQKQRRVSWRAIHSQSDKITLLLLLLTLSCHAQTNVIWGYLGDYTLNPLPGNVQITLVDPNPRNINGVLVSPLYPPINFGTNGTFAITNLPFGTYRTLFDSGLTFPFYVLTNTFGSNNIANLGTFASVTPPPYIILNSGTTLFVQLTNGPGISFVNLATNVSNGYTNVLTQVRTN